MEIVEWSVKIELESDTTVNYATQQNDVPIIKSLRITNLTQSPLTDIVVRINTDPAFTEPIDINLSSLEAGATVDLGVIDLHPSHDFLAYLAERVVGSIVLKVGKDQEILGSTSCRIEVLAYDEWIGLRSPPELLAAFVAPNNGAIERILREASDVLLQGTGDPSLSGYQTKNLDRVYKTISAIYTAVQKHHIAYSNPPASFESSGQKVRMPDRILGTGLGTCLDLSALLAACAEQAGLHPILVINDGHAYVGVWLNEECFADVVTYDIQRLRKRVDLKEMCVFESTLVTDVREPSFQVAVDAGRRHLDNDADYRFAIDVKRARIALIRPLPSRSEDGTIVTVDVPEIVVQGGDKLPTLTPLVVAGENAEASASRLDRWTRRLLDLSMTNRLLNFKISKSTLQILCPDLVTFENMLSDGKPFRIFPQILEMGENDARSAQVHLQRTGRDAMVEQLNGEMKARRLYTDLPEAELSKRLLDIYRKSKLSVEESGVNTSYIALGFLSWYETETSEAVRLAPIILIPLTVTRASVQEGFNIRIGDEEPIINITLLEMMARDHGITVPGMDPIPMDESGVDVEGILNAFRKAIKDKNRWEVREIAVIGHFSFAKFLMWRDLQVRSGDLMRNKVVAHLINTPNLPFQGPRDFPDLDKLDEQYSPQSTFCPVSADSSQLAAIYAAASGKSFVLHGPPGTGKSQTITNIIAHSLAMGETVLFISEKRAALEVVHKRLQDCGLGPFCLELHSNKSNKVAFLEQLRDAMEFNESSSSGEWMDEARRLETLRRDLNEYVSHLHKVRPSGDTVFSGISHLIGLRNYPNLRLELLSPGPMTKERRERLSGLVSQLELAATGIEHPSKNVWSTADYPDWTNSLTNDILEALSTGVKACTQEEQATREAAPYLALPQDGWSWATHQAVRDVAIDLIDMLPKIPSSAVLVDRPEEMETEVRRWITIGRERDALRTDVYKAFDPRALSIDVASIGTQISKSFETWLTDDILEHSSRGVEDWVESLRREIITPQERLDSDLESSMRIIPEAARALGLEARGVSFTSVSSIGKLADRLLNPPSVPIPRMLAIQDWESNRMALKEAVAHGRKRDELRGRLYERYTPDLLKQDLDGIRKETITCKSSWFLPRILGYGRIKKKIISASRGTIPAIDQLILDLETAIALNAEESAVERAGAIANGLVGIHWKSGEADWNAIEEAINYCDDVRAALLSTCRALGHEPSIVRSRLASMLAEEGDRFAPEGDIGKKLHLARASANCVAEDLGMLKAAMGEDSLRRWDNLPLEQIVEEMRLWVVQFEALSSLKCVSVNGRVPPYSKLLDDLALLQELVKKESELSTHAMEATEVLGELWRGGEADWTLIEQTLEQCARLRSHASTLKGDITSALELVAQWGEVVDQGRKTDSSLQRMMNALSHYVQADDSTQASMRMLERLIMIGERAAWGELNCPDFIKCVSEKMEIWTAKVPELKAWCHWRSVRREAIKEGLSKLVESFESEVIKASDIAKVFEHSYYYEWVESEVASDQILNRFYSRDFEHKIELFRSTDQRFSELTKMEIRARVASRLPPITGMENDNSEPGILRRQMMRQRGHMPVRALLQKIPNLLPRLKPCLLMSPISVAQYLDPKHPAFDLVVFDEASQMPVWDAVGAIARGNEVIVVGDPQQLSPTNFFGRSDSDDSSDTDDGMVSEVESILTECISAGLPQQYLLWHYRSRHESLIAFSNNKYYKNKLLTFPSPQDDTAVRFCYVGGTYDRGVSRTNKVEAEAIVAEIVRRLRDPQLSGSSIGVVTFSMQQQGIIEDLLDEARRKYPEIETFFDSKLVQEPVFVKNLENVQGDERDVIMFSICYGPDLSGKMSMSFGPVNSDGGERRLNVAITRAKQEVLVFTSIRADQIDTSRTKSLGVTHLKYFLDYAERGMVAIKEQVATNPEGESESYFEERVAEALKGKGYQIHHQVGCSGYRIDLAVVDPERPGRYILGIECDGANYHRAKTARDRDKLREGVLTNLGWKLHRIWSTDWWHSPESELTKIEAAIEEAMRAKPFCPVAQSPPAIKEADKVPKAIAANESGTAYRRIEPPALPIYSTFCGNSIYEPEEFYSGYHSRQIATVLEDIVRSEGPVPLQVAGKRLAGCCGIKRCTENVLQRLESIIPMTSLKVTRYGGSSTLWPSTIDPLTYSSFRVPGSTDDSKRKVEEIPVEELANGVEHVLKQQISLPRDDLVKETARLFGFLRIGQNVDSRIREAIDLLVKRGRIADNGENIAMAEGH